MVDRSVAGIFAVAGAFWLALAVLAWQLPSVVMIAIAATFIVTGSLLMAIRRIPAAVKVPLIWSLAILAMFGFFALTSSDSRPWELFFAGTLVGTLAFGLWLVSGLVATRFVRSRSRRQVA